jgi:uncharacterized protein
MSLFLTAIGLMFVFEGLIYCGFPQFVKRMASSVIQLSENKLRVFGLSCMFFGVMIVWLVRG